MIKPTPTHAELIERLTTNFLRAEELYGPATPAALQAYNQRMESAPLMDEAHLYDLVVRLENKLAAWAGAQAFTPVGFPGGTN